MVGYTRLLSLIAFFNPMVKDEKEEIERQKFFLRESKKEERIFASGIVYDVYVYAYDAYVYAYDVYVYAYDAYVFDDCGRKVPQISGNLNIWWNKMHRLSKFWNQLMVRLIEHESMIS